VALVQVSVLRQPLMSVHSGHVSAIPSWRKRPTAQAVHCEVEALVQDKDDVQSMTGVHATHGPGLPLSQDPAGQAVHWFAPGPLQAVGAQDESHWAEAPAGSSHRTPVTMRTSSRGIGRKP